MSEPITEHWKSLRPWQAWSLIAVGLLLELPVRWVIRPDMPYLRPGNPWFNLPLRIALELGLVLAVLLAVALLRVRPSQVGAVWRRWTRWEWVAFVIVGSIELAVVVGVAGGRWPRLAEAGVLGGALGWAFGEFWFGFNQEFVFRGPLMSGLMRLSTPFLAIVMNTVLFLAGPLHGPGLLRMLPTNPEGAAWMLAGVVATGLFFSWLRYRTDNLVLCSVLHGIVNAFLNGSGLAGRAYL
jgi:membrane protease YdiL (CAAX protease family)